MSVRVKDAVNGGTGIVPKDAPEPTHHAYRGQTYGGRDRDGSTGKAWSPEDAAHESAAFEDTAYDGAAYAEVGTAYVGDDVAYVGTAHEGPSHNVASCAPRRDAPGAALARAASEVLRAPEPSGYGGCAERRARAAHVSRTEHP